MYANFPNNQQFYQGDILQDTPFFIIPKGFSRSKPASVQNLTVMILTQTCDIEHRDFVIIGRVINFQELEDTGLNQNFLRSLRQRKVKYWFYLPSSGEFPESYVDFTQIIYTPKNTLKKRNRIQSLDDLGRHWLAYQISDYFGRPFDPTQYGQE